MAGDCGLNALSLLLENVLPQWQQKIAYLGQEEFFAHLRNFLQVLDLLIFRQ